MQNFQADTDDIKKLIKFYKSLPHLYQRTIADFLNKIAYEGRQEMIKELKQTNTIRAQQLLNLLIRYQKANPGHSIDNQYSRAGSILGKVDRHDSFLHIAEGTATRATLFTTAGRGGNQQKKSLAAARAGAERHTNIGDFNLQRSGNDRMMAYLQAISRDQTRRRKPFYLPQRYKRMPPGVYKFTGGRVGKYQTGNRKISGTLVGAKIKKLSEPGSVMHPKKNSWHEVATKRTIRESNLRQWWIESNVRQMEKLAKKCGLL